MLEKSVALWQVLQTETTLIKAFFLKLVATACRGKTDLSQLQRLSRDVKWADGCVLLIRWGQSECALRRRCINQQTSGLWSNYKLRAVKWRPQSLNQLMPG